jgi:hypothetical protein
MANIFWYFDIAVRGLVIAVGAYTLPIVAAERGEDYVPPFSASQAGRLSVPILSRSERPTQLVISRTIAHHFGRNENVLGKTTRI